MRFSAEHAKHRDWGGLFHTGKGFWQREEGCLAHIANRSRLKGGSCFFNAYYYTVTLICSMTSPFLSRNTTPQRASSPMM